MFFVNLQKPSPSHLDSMYLSQPVGANPCSATGPSGPFGFNSSILSNPPHLYHMRYLRQWHGIPGQNPQFRLRGSLFEPRGFQFIVDYQGFWLPSFQIIDISKIQAYKPPIHQSLLESAVRASNSSIVIEGSGLRASNKHRGFWPPGPQFIYNYRGFWFPGLQFIDN